MCLLKKKSNYELLLFVESRRSLVANMELPPSRVPITDASTHGSQRVKYTIET